MVGFGFFVVVVLFLIHVTITTCNEEICTRESEGQSGHHKLNQHMKLIVEGLGFKKCIGKHLSSKYSQNNINNYKLFSDIHIILYHCHCW